MANPFFHAHTDHFAGPEKLDAWRQILGDVYEIDRPPSDDPGPFNAFSNAFAAGDGILTESCASSLVYERSRKLIARSGIDVLLVHLCLNGGFIGQAGEREVVAHPGDMILLDLGQECRFLSEESLCFSFAFPRDAAVLGNGNAHGVVLPSHSGRGALLAAHFHTLREQVARIESSALPALAKATVALADACFAPSAGTLERAGAEVAGATVLRIKRYILENLRRPDLNADLIAAQFRISRSHLYRLFEPLEGVHRYIQAERLKRCYGELVRSENRHRRISTVAFDWGFTNEAHFSRAFRHMFGLSPSDARLVGRTPSSLIHQAASVGLLSPLQLLR